MTQLPRRLLAAATWLLLVCARGSGPRVSTRAASSPSAAGAGPSGGAGGAAGLFDDWRRSRLAPLLHAYAAAGAGRSDARRLAFVHDGMHGGGLGDVMLGVISSFVLALGTDRRFLLDFRHPAPLELVYRPNGVDWRVDAALASSPGWRAALRRATRVYDPNRFATDVLARRFPHALEVVTTCRMRAFVYVLRNHAVRAVLHRHGLDALRPPLTYAEVASAALAFLFAPTPALDAAVRGEMAALAARAGGSAGWRGRPVVAVHVRAGVGVGENFARMADARAHLDRYAACASAWGRLLGGGGTGATAVPRPGALAAVVIFTDSVALRRPELYFGAGRGGGGGGVPILFTNSTPRHTAKLPVGSVRGANATCARGGACAIAAAPRAEALLAVFTEWHALAQLPFATGGGLVLTRSGFGETSSWLHRGLRRFKVPFDNCTAPRDPVPRVELDYAIGTKWLPAHEMGKCPGSASRGC